MLRRFLSTQRQMLRVNRNLGQNQRGAVWLLRVPGSQESAISPNLMFHKVSGQRRGKN